MVGVAEASGVGEVVGVAEAAGVGEASGVGEAVGVAEASGDGMVTGLGGVVGIAEGSGDGAIIGAACRVIEPLVLKPSLSVAATSKLMGKLSTRSGARLPVS